MIFNDIAKFIEYNSFGPISILFTDIDKKRFAVIQPLNYYIVFENREIYLLINSSLNNNDRENAVKFTRAGHFKVTSAIKKAQIYNIIKTTANPIYRFILVNEKSKDSKITIDVLLNKCIEKGIFQI